MEPELDDLDGRLKRFYEHQSLSPAAMDRLKRQVENGHSPGARGMLMNRRYAWLQMAAVLAIVAGGVYFAARWQADSGATSDVSQMAARDVALHHRKQFSLDFNAQTMEQLSREMTKLDFNPILPARMRNGPRLAGARYCAVLGQIAAQFRFTDPDGRPCTLYQTRCQGQFADLPDARFDIDGTHVELWREAGLLMVMAYSDQQPGRGSAK